jgi:hypothetical protein
VAWEGIEKDTNMSYVASPREISQKAYRKKSIKNHTEQKNLLLYIELCATAAAIASSTS